MSDTTPRKRLREATGAPDAPGASKAPFKAPTVDEVISAAKPGTPGPILWERVLAGRMEEDFLAIENKRLVVGLMVKVTGTGSLWRCAEGTLSTGCITAVNATRETLAGTNLLDDLKPGYVTVQFTKIKQRNKKLKQFEMAFRASMLSILTELELTRAEHQFETGVYPYDIDELKLKKQIHKDLIALDKRRLVVGGMVEIDQIPPCWCGEYGRLFTGRILAVNTTHEDVAGLLPGGVKVQFTRLKGFVDPDAGEQHASSPQFEYSFRASHVVLVPTDRAKWAEHQFETGEYPNPRDFESV
jgi:hypothetical protein